MNIRTFFVSVTDDRAGQVAAMAQMIGVEESMIEHSPFALIGSTDKMIEDISARRVEYGFSYVIVGADELEAFAPVVAALAGK